MYGGKSMRHVKSWSRLNDNEVVSDSEIIHGCYNAYYRYKIVRQVDGTWKAFIFDVNKGYNSVKATNGLRGLIVHILEEVGVTM